MVAKFIFLLNHPKINIDNLPKIEYFNKLNIPAIINNYQDRHYEY